MSQVFNTLGLDVAVIAGGSLRPDVKVLSSANPVGFGYDCAAGVADLPIPLKGGFGFADKDGKPMVCGGKSASRTYNRQCYVYEKANNTWIEGPTILRKRSKSAAVGLPDGSTWVIGGLK